MSINGTEIYSKTKDSPQKERQVTGHKTQEIERIRDYCVDFINQQIVGKLAYRDRPVIIDLWVDGYSLEQTAEHNNLSRSQVQRISDKHAKVIEKLSPYLKK